MVWHSLLSWAVNSFIQFTKYIPTAYYVLPLLFKGSIWKYVDRVLYSACLDIINEIIETETVELVVSCLVTDEFMLHNKIRSFILNFLIKLSFYFEINYFILITYISNHPSFNHRRQTIWNQTSLWCTEWRAFSFLLALPIKNQIHINT